MFRRMRGTTLTVFTGLYLLFGGAFVTWTLAGEPPLPAWAMLTIAGVAWVIALGIVARVRAARWLAVVAHAFATGAAAVFAILHTLGRVDGGDYASFGAKFVTHAAMLWFWLRARSVRSWFGPG